MEQQETDPNHTKILSSVEKLEIPIEKIADIHSVSKTQQEKKIRQGQEKLQIAINYT